ncbi:MAG: hypothetical protein A2020_12230 [Lentisphaerae bacterium GWF2_45_14]|nr:MAG: hypothetical protein A2020_12230 [Lentisphaerae bacterium GWF2_45_14]
MRQKSLTQKQRNFALRFLECGNAADAYRYAYSVNKSNNATIRRRAHDVLHTPLVAEFIDQNSRKAQMRTGITVDKVLCEYAKIAFTNLPGIVNFRKGTMSLKDFEKLTQEQRACIKKFKVTTVMKLGEDRKPIPVDKVEVELHDKIHALDSIAKHLGMFIDKTETQITDKTELEKAKALFATMTPGEKLQWLKSHSQK